MRLRYLHLPRFGPLADIEIVFGQEAMLFGPGEPGKRKGAINFIVGVNGTGKSSLLRALYLTFRSLRSQELPPFPVTLAWDWDDGQQTATAIFHYPGSLKDQTFFSVFIEHLPSESADYWRDIVKTLADESRRINANPPLPKQTIPIRGEEAVKTMILQAHLPRKIVAYTTGAETLWESLEQREFNADIEQVIEAHDERLQGWSIERELEKEQPIQFNNALNRIAAILASNKNSSWEQTTSDLFDELEASGKIRNKVLKTLRVRVNQNSEPCFRVRAEDLRLAAIVLALWQTAQEMKGMNSEAEREGLRRRWLESQSKAKLGTGARQMFNQLDWFWPTHLSFTYYDRIERVYKRQREELLCLLALSDEVTAQPLGRHRVVISLGPKDALNFADRLREAMPDGLLNDALEADTDWVDGTNTTGAEAVMRVFSGNDSLDSKLLEVFEKLRDWRNFGLLEDITLTIKRLNQTKNADGEPDDVLVTFDQLSDGEQMLLGRMALLYLLRGQHGALLLLDEPETHFNDVWKREIIDWVDGAILKDTAALVIVATHTSIALTDVFASEILRLTRRDGHTEASAPAFPTFGADLAASCCMCLARPMSLVPAPPSSCGRS